MAHTISNTNLKIGQVNRQIYKVPHLHLQRAAVGCSEPNTKMIGQSRSVVLSCASSGGSVVDPIVMKIMMIYI